MNKSVLLHGAWLLVAIGTFAAGRYAMPAADKGTASAADPSGSTRLLDPVENPGRASSAGGSSKASGSGAGAFSPGEFNVSSAISAYKSEQDPLKKNLLFAELLMGMTADNAADVLAMLQEDGGRNRDMGRQMGLLFQSWGKLDGEAAVAAALAINEEGGDRRGGPGGGFGFGNMYAAAAISAWSKTDRAGAEAWLNAQEDGPQKTALNMGYINGLAETDPDAATAYVLAMADKAPAEGADQRRGGFDMTGRYYEMITRQQIQRGLDTATTWAEGLPEGDFKASALSSIASQMAREDIDAAKAWVAKYGDQDFARNAVGEIAQRMSREDPKAAVDWVMEMPEASQGRALYSAFNEWTDKDATAASEYLAAMPDSSAKDSAVAGFVRELDNEDPASAAAWAVTIQDEQTRQRTVMEVAGSWYRQDQAAATQFMNENGISAEAQQMIISRSSQRGPGGFGGGDRGPGGFGRGGGR